VFKCAFIVTMCSSAFEIRSYVGMSFFSHKNSLPALRVSEGMQQKVSHWSTLVTMCSSAFGIRSYVGMSFLSNIIPPPLDTVDLFFRSFSHDF